MQGAWHLLFWFECDWGLLTDSQKETLVPVLEEVYENFSEYMAHFVISELLGRFLCNEQSLGILRRLDKKLRARNEIARAAIPVGLGYLASHPTNVLLREAAIKELRRMTLDQSPEVRDEAALILRKAIARGRPMN